MVSYVLGVSFFCFVGIVLVCRPWKVLFIAKRNTNSGVFFCGNMKSY